MRTRHIGKADKSNNARLNAEGWIKRAKEVLTNQQVAFTQSVPFAVSLLTSVYGPQSTQLKAFTDQLKAIAKGAATAANSRHHQVGLALGAINNTVAELQGGLVASLRTLIAGEIFGELVALPKEILEDQTETAKNVAAVLVAATLEELIRRMGTELASVPGRPEMQTVLVELKDAAVLKGGELALAQSYLKFRNDSLHADWAQVQRSQVESCLAFIEELLVKHFS
jgi:hypothetical protein